MLESKNVTGLEKAKEALNNMIMALKNDQKCIESILLVGASRTRKTYLINEVIKEFSEQNDLSFFVMRGIDINSAGPADRNINIKHCLQEAGELKEPLLLFIDNAEMCFPELPRASQQITANMLNMLADFSCMKKVAIFATANKKGNIFRPFQIRCKTIHID